MIPKHYQQGFNTCDYKDSQEKVNTTGMQEITESGVYVGTFYGGFLSDYQSKQDGTPGTSCQVTFVTDDNRLFSKVNIGFLYNGQYTKLGMAILMLAQDPFGQRAELFPRIAEGEKDGRAWYKLEDADSLHVTVVLFVNGTYQSNDGSVHPRSEILGIFDGNGHSPAENRDGRKETAALNSRKHWLKIKIEEAVSIPQQGGYQQWQQQAPAQGYQQVSIPPQVSIPQGQASGGKQQQWQTKVSQPRQPSPTQSLDMAVAAQQAAMARAQQQRQTSPQPQGQWAGFNAPPPQQSPAPDPRQFVSIPQGQTSGGKQNFQDDALPF